MEVLLGVWNKEISLPNVFLLQMITFCFRFQMEPLSVDISGRIPPRKPCRMLGILQQMSQCSRLDTSPVIRDKAKQLNVTCLLEILLLELCFVVVLCLPFTRWLLPELVNQFMSNQPNLRYDQNNVGNLGRVVWLPKQNKAKTTQYLYCWSIFATFVILINVEHHRNFIKQIHLATNNSSSYVFE